MKKRILEMMALFCVMMLLFTILSRAADSVSTAKVRTVKAERGKISHKVSGSGKVVQNREHAIAVLPGQRVSTIYVEEGQQVEKGEVLFEVDLAELQEQILKQKQEMKKEELLSQDKASSRDAQQQRNITQQNRAAEDYSVAAGKGNTAVSRAAQELNNARQKLNELEKNAGSTDGSDAVEEVLKRTCEEKALEYDQAVKYKEELEKAIDEAVTQALEEQQSGQSLAVLVGNDREVMMAAEPEPVDSEPETAAGEGEAVDAQSELYINIEEAASDQYADTEQTDDAEMYIGLEQEPDTEQIIDSETENIQLQTENPWLLEQRIRQQNQSLLDEAEKLIKQKEAEKEAADAALLCYQQSKAAGTQQSVETVKEQLEEEIRLKKQAYEDAVTAANDSLRSAGRAVEDASASQGTDSTGEIDAIVREQAELQLSKLENLMEAEGKVLSPIDGIVTEIHIMTGERSTDGTAILLADAKAGCKLVIQVPIGQEKYIARNDKAVVKADGKKKEWKDLTIDSVRISDENKEMLDVTVQLPADSLEIGEAATLTVTKISESYDCCIPVSAIYQNNGKYFVYVVNETESVLGTELTLQRIDVTVLDKNETDAALQTGSISSQQEVVISANKSISDGSRVRMME